MRKFWGFILLLLGVCGLFASLVGGLVELGIVGMGRDNTESEASGIFGIEAFVLLFTIPFAIATYYGYRLFKQGEAAGEPPHR